MRKKVELPRSDLLTTEDRRNENIGREARRHLATFHDDFRQNQKVVVAQMQPRSLRLSLDGIDEFQLPKQECGQTRLRKKEPERAR